MIEFDAEIQLPSVLASADRSGFTRREHSWTIAIRLDDANAAEVIGKDIIPMPDVDGFSVNALQLRSRGFGPVNELALTVWALQHGPSSTKQRVLFAVSTSFLLEIAKLRAFRAIVDEAELWAIGDVRNLSSQDPASNGIRTTLQTVAAVWGMADCVCILPNNAPVDGFTDHEAARLAANIGRMLREESYVDQVPDPTVGSALLDTAVGRLVDAARKRIQEFEETGATTLDSLLAHRFVEQLRVRDQAWWASRTNRKDS